MTDTEQLLQEIDRMCYALECEGGSVEVGKLLGRCADALRSTPTPAPSAGGTISWLIECPKGTVYETGAGFWCGHRTDPNMMVWSDNANDAVRFVRKEDAENTLRIMRTYMSNDHYRNHGAYDEMYVAEHMWCPEPAAPSPQSGAEQAAPDKLFSIAAGWKLRALELEKCGVTLSVSCLRECAEELEAVLQGRDPKRTSWYKHEAAPKPDEALLREADTLVKEIISHEEAEEILCRFNSSHWKNDTERARYTIPADPRRDDDLRLHAYIEQNKVREKQLSVLRSRSDALPASIDGSEVIYCGHCERPHRHDRCSFCGTRFNAALRSQSAAPSAVPEGFVLVPDKTISELLSVSPDKCPARIREALYELTSIATAPKPKETTHD